MYIIDTTMVPTLTTTEIGRRTATLEMVTPCTTIPKDRRFMWRWVPHNVSKGFILLTPKLHSRCIGSPSLTDWLSRRKSLTWHYICYSGLAPQSSSCVHVFLYFVFAAVPVPSFNTPIKRAHISFLHIQSFENLLNLEGWSASSTCSGAILLNNSAM